MPSTGENTAIVHRLYDELNRGNFDIVDEIMSPSFVAHGEALGLDQTMSDRRAALKQGIIWARKAFKDLVVKVEDTISEGDQVACRLTYHGTQADVVDAVTAAGNEVTFTAIAINRFDQGKIVERWFNWDGLGMANPVGATHPEPTSETS